MEIPAAESTARPATLPRRCPALYATRRQMLAPTTWRRTGSRYRDKSFPAPGISKLFIPWPFPRPDVRGKAVKSAASCRVNAGWRALIVRIIMRDSSQFPAEFLSAGALPAYAVEARPVSVIPMKKARPEIAGPRLSKKWLTPLLRGSKFGQPEVARICKELILQAKSTTRPAGKAVGYE